MTLYSFRGAYPDKLPDRIRLSSGRTRTDSSTFTAEELVDAGYIVADKPSADYPQKVDWNTETKQWVVRDPNDAEIAFKWQEIRNQCQKLLDSTDYKVIKAVEAGQPVDPVYVTYRQELRDLYNNVNNIDPWNVVYPLLRFEQGPIPSE